MKTRLYSPSELDLLPGTGLLKVISKNCGQWKHSEADA
jgi:hypothetical protein